MVENIAVSIEIIIEAKKIIGLSDTLIYTYTYNINDY